MEGERKGGEGKGGRERERGRQGREERERGREGRERGVRERGVSKRGRERGRNREIAQLYHQPHSTSSPHLHVSAQDIKRHLQKRPVLSAEGLHHPRQAEGTVVGQVAVYRLGLVGVRHAEVEVH